MRDHAWTVPGARQHTEPRGHSPHCPSLPLTAGGWVGQETLPEVVPSLCQLVAQTELQALHKGLEVSQLQGLPDLLI